MWKSAARARVYSPLIANSGRLPTLFTRLTRPSGRVFFPRIQTWFTLFLVTTVVRSGYRRLRGWHKETNAVIPILRAELAGAIIAVNASKIVHKAVYLSSSIVCLFSQSGKGTVVVEEHYVHRRL